MAKARKSPQEKKSLELTKDHFTGGFHSTQSFHKKWKQKKTLANHEYRRKSKELLAPAKPGIGAKDLPLIVEDLTAGRFEKSVVRKTLKKVGTITIGEKIKWGLANREERVGRRVRSRKSDHLAAVSVIRTLSSLEGEGLIDFVRRAGRLCEAIGGKEAQRVLLSKDSLDQALYFIYRLHFGMNSPADTICRDEELHKALSAWAVKANRILRRDLRVLETKVEQKQANEKKLRTLRGAANEVSGL